MKASELRIGNYILLDGDEIMVTGVNGSIVYWMDGYDVTALSGSKIEGIYMTEERALKLGFKKRKEQDIITYYKSGFVICFNTKHHITCTYKGAFLRNVSFIHELQNLYFALTGDELIITN